MPIACRTVKGRLGKGDLPVERLQRTPFLPRVRFAGRPARRARRFLKMFVGLLIGQMPIDSAAQHPADLMAELFHLSERRISRRSVGPISFRSDEGQQVLGDLYNITGLVPASDSDYDVVRSMGESLGFEVEKALEE